MFFRCNFIWRLARGAHQETSEMMNRIWGIGLGLALLASPVAMAAPTGGACTDPAVSGYSVYVNCGDYIATISDNDRGGPLTIGTVSYAQLAKFDNGSGWTNDPGNPKSLTFSDATNTYGTWSLPFAVQFMIVKAGDEFTIYGQGSVVDGTIPTYTGLSSGFWATAPELVNENNSNARRLSHISFYGRVGGGGGGGGGGGNVPEPGLIGLLGLGLAGIGLARRRATRREQ